MIERLGLWMKVRKLEKTVSILFYSKKREILKRVWVNVGLMIIDDLMIIIDGSLNIYETNKNKKSSS